MSESRCRALMVLLATLVGMAVTARLGLWQLSRAAQKEALQSALDARSRLPELSMHELPRSEADALAQHYRPLRLQGEWVAGSTRYLDNRQMNGRVGFFVVTALQLGPDDAVLVQRGWVPRDMQERTHVIEPPTPSGSVSLRGLLAPAPGRLFEFGGAGSGPIRQNLLPADFSREIGVGLRPWSVLQLDTPQTAGDGLLRQWPRPAERSSMHYGYAFQWFGLCALMAILYVWFQLLRPRLQRSA